MKTNYGPLDYFWVIGIGAGVVLAFVSGLFPIGFQTIVLTVAAIMLAAGVISLPIKWAAEGIVRALTADREPR